MNGKECRDFYETHDRCDSCGCWESVEEGIYDYAGYFLCSHCEGEYVICADCRCFARSEDAHKVDGEFVCDSCYEHYVICNDCGRLVLQAYSHEIDYGNRVVCNDCRWNYTECDRCGRRFTDDEVSTDNDGQAICSECMYDYTRCINCDMLIQEEYAHEDREGECWCDYCWDNYQQDTIHDYNYKPCPEFFGEGTSLFLGVELEIDEGGNDPDNAQEILDIVGDQAYLKHDGSLDDGFEIVTHPCTLQYHLDHFPWEEVVNKCSDMGYTSHDAGTCGLHVHMSKDFFVGEDGNEGGIAKLLYLTEKFWEYIVKFSRRTERQIDEWASRYYFDGDPDELLDHAKGTRDRYRCVNLQNEHTIELRVFRGTLKLNTLLATLQFCEHLAGVAVYASVQECQEMTWEKFIGRIPEEYSELEVYLEERNLK